VVPFVKKVRVIDYDIYIHRWEEIEKMTYIYTYHVSKNPSPEWFQILQMTFAGEECVQWRCDVDPACQESDFPKLWQFFVGFCG
jgi:hypothetical protein